MNMLYEKSSVHIIVDPPAVPWAPGALLWPQLSALLAPWLRGDVRGAARWRDAALAAVAADRYHAHVLAARQTLVDYYEVTSLALPVTIFNNKIKV